MTDFGCCTLCPRKCKADRTRQRGYCGANDKMTVSRAGLHFFEEPPISGKNGSGAIFFSGCSLHCVYCQNSLISGGKTGKEIGIDRLRDIAFELKEKGAHNINLVTPTHYAPLIREALLPIKKELSIPIIYNTGGYESDESLQCFEGLADIFLPDFKYAHPDAALLYSGAPDYPSVALEAIEKMTEYAGKPIFDENGMMTSGVIVRHLVLPGERMNSLDAVGMLYDRFGNDRFLLSLMSQYTPGNSEIKQLARRVTTFEYESVLKRANELGFSGFSQEKESAKSSYIPDFDLTGV